MSVVAFALLVPLPPSTVEQRQPDVAPIRAEKSPDPTLEMGWLVVASLALLTLALVGLRFFRT